MEEGEWTHEMQGESFSSNPGRISTVTGIGYLMYPIKMVIVLMAFCSVSGCFFIFRNTRNASVAKLDGTAKDLSLQCDESFFNTEFSGIWYAVIV